MLLSWEAVIGLLGVVSALAAGMATFVHLSISKALSALENRIMAQLAAGFVTKSGCDAAHLVNQIRIDAHDKRVERIEGHIERIEAQLLELVTEMKTIVRDNGRAIRVLTGLMQYENGEDDN